jgi:hypothetical protein
MEPLTSERLSELLSYSPDEGFTWLKLRSIRVQHGVICALGAEFKAKHRPLIAPRRRRYEPVDDPSGFWAQLLTHKLLFS